MSRKHRFEIARASRSKSWNEPNSLQRSELTTRRRDGTPEARGPEWSGIRVWRDASTKDDKA